MVPSSSWSGHDPLKVETRVRISVALQKVGNFAKINYQNLGKQIFFVIFVILKFIDKTNTYISKTITSHDLILGDHSSKVNLRWVPYS